MFNFETPIVTEIWLYEPFTIALILFLIAGVNRICSVIKQSPNLQLNEGRYRVFLLFMIVHAILSVGHLVTLFLVDKALMKGGYFVDNEQAYKFFRRDISYDRSTTVLNTFAFFRNIVTTYFLRKAANV